VADESSLSPEKLQLFIASLANLPADEVRKAKVLYIRNAITDLKRARASVESFQLFQLFFWIVPCFWPMVIAQRRMMQSQLGAHADRIRNALDVWKDDLRGETFDLDALEDGDATSLWC
jgi:hypothetical protein